MYFLVIILRLCLRSSDNAMHFAVYQKTSAAIVSLLQMPFAIVLRPRPRSPDFSMHFAINHIRHPHSPDFPMHLAINQVRRPHLPDFRCTLPSTTYVVRARRIIACMYINPNCVAPAH